MEFLLYAKIIRLFRTSGKIEFTLDVEFTANQGITVLFGPSGSGKTTILKAISGILRPESGRISLNARPLFDSDRGIDVPIQRRKVGFVFQNYLLFPHLRVAQNIAYGINSPSTKERQLKVQKMIELFGIGRLANRYPHELSGGEQQKVAIARALVSGPSIILLDEPLSAVDVETRASLLDEILMIQKTSEIPFLYVTHNISEVIRIGSYMYVLHDGKVIQEGTPLHVFSSPSTLKIAKLVGTENIFVGKVASHKIQEGLTVLDLGGSMLEVPYNKIEIGSQVTIGIRSEDIIITLDPRTQTSARNMLEGKVVDIMHGAEGVELIVNCGVNFKVSVTPAAIKQMNIRVGSTVYILVKARACYLLA